MDGHVAMVLRESFPPDVRVQKEARALLDAGIDVTVVCSKDPQRPKRETDDGIEIVRVGLDSTGRLEKVSRHVRVALTGVRPEWCEALAGLESLDAIHVHDLPMAGTALFVGERLRVPVVLDLHENYPAAVEQYRAAEPDWWRSPGDVAERLTFPVARFRRFERRWTKRAAHVVTVAAEARRHYVHDCAVPPLDVSVVGNTVDLGSFDRSAPPTVDTDGFTVAYVGSFGPHRGLDTALRGFAEVAATAPDAEFLLVGSGAQSVVDGLGALVSDLGISDRVTAPGWVDFEAVPGYIAAADVCLVPHARTEHTATTIPHKLFQYMAMERPVVVTDVPPLERIVSATDSGRVVPAGDARELGDTLEALRTDPSERRRLGENGREAVEHRYNWATDAETLRSIYAELIEGS